MILGFIVVLLMALGLHALLVDLDPVHLLVTVAVVGVAYHLAVALIRRYVWPGKQ